MEEIAEQTKRFQAATEQRFDRMDQRLGRVEARLDRVIDDLGPLKGAHAGNVAVKEASLIALDLGLRYRKSLTRMELGEPFRCRRHDTMSPPTSCAASTGPMEIGAVRRSYAVVEGLLRDDRIQDRVDAGEVLGYQLTPQAMQAD